MNETGLQEVEQRKEYYLEYRGAPHPASAICLSVQERDDLCASLREALRERDEARGLAEDWAFDAEYDTLPWRKA